MRLSARGVPADGVDRVSKEIRGFSVITMGEARGHGMEIDATTLDQVVAVGNKSKIGIKSRFGHPNMSDTAMGKELGRVQNFRVDGDRVRADLKFIDAAFDTPQHGNLADYVMRLAEKDPDMFGASIVFDGKHEEKLDENGEPVTDARGRKIRLARVEKMTGVDMVDEPAANLSMFGLAGDVELSAQASLFFDKFLESPAAVEKALSFLQRYLSNRESAQYQEEAPLPPKETEVVVSVKADEETKEALNNAEQVRLAEKDRVKKILAAAFPGQEALARDAIDKDLSVEEAQALFIEHEKKKDKAKLERLQTNTVPVLGPNTGDEPRSQEKDAEAALEDGEYDEEGLSARWEKDANIRREFAAKEHYLAWAKAFSQGRIKTQVK